MNLQDAINGKLDNELNAAFQEAFEPRLFVIYKPIHGEWGYYREKGAGYTSRDKAWRVTEQEGAKYVTGRKTDPDRVILHPAPQHDYINALESLGLVHEAEKTLSYEQRCKNTDNLEMVIGGPAYKPATYADARQRVIAIMLTIKPEIFE